MKFQNPFFFCVVLAIALFLFKKGDDENGDASNSADDFKLIVERGAFHFDRFEMTSTAITYYAKENSAHEINKYNNNSKVELDSTDSLKFLKQIETEGFWNLDDVYTETSSCTSQLKITLTANGKTKQVICDDFERACPKLLRLIEKKVIDLEGNNLKRIYLPG